MNLDTETIRPVGDRMLVEVYKAETESESGVVIADTQTNSAPTMGVILRSGPLSKYETGQTVMFRRYAIDELKINAIEGEQIVYFLEDNDILATVDGDAPITSRSSRYPQIAEVRNVDAPPEHADGTSKKGEEGSQEPAEVAEEVVSEKEK